MARWWLRQLRKARTKHRLYHSIVAALFARYGFIQQLHIVIIRRWFSFSSAAFSAISQVACGDWRDLWLCHFLFNRSDAMLDFSIWLFSPMAVFVVIIGLTCQFQSSTCSTKPSMNNKLQFSNTMQFMLRSCGLRSVFWRNHSKFGWGQHANCWQIYVTSASITQKRKRARCCLISNRKKMDFITEKSRIARPTWRTAAKCAICRVKWCVFFVSVKVPSIFVALSASRSLEIDFELKRKQQNCKNYFHWSSETQRWCLRMRKWYGYVFDGKSGATMTNFSFVEKIDY